jgi:hypothetical protein
MGVLKFPQLGILQLWGCITSRAYFWLQWGLKQSCSPCQDLFNNMFHVTFTPKNWIDSWLLVVGSETANLTPNLSFDHNLCFRCPNGQCEPILDIYVSIDFSNDINNFSNRWVLTPTIALWRFGIPFGIPTSTPTMGVHLGVWRFIHSQSLHSREHVMWLPGLPLGLQPCNPLPRSRA